MNSDALVERYRERAVRDLTHLIEATRLHEFNTNLANEFFIFMLDMMTEEVDIEDRVALVEDVMSTYDHDLSDYLLLADYHVHTEVVEDPTDPIINATLQYKGKDVFRIKLSFAEARLMACKRSKSRAGTQK